MGNNFRHSKSLERFIYRKEIEIAHDKLSEITKSLASAILIFDSNKNVLFHNSQVFELMSCTEDNLKESLEMIEYCPGKKLSNFNDSNKVIDDIEYLLALEDHQSLYLGVSFCNDENSRLE